MQIPPWNSFKARADELVNENERVRKDLQHYIEKMLKHTEGQAIGDTTSSVIQGSMPGVDTEAYSDLTEMADVLNKTNSIMTEQIAMLETELGRTKSSEKTATERLAKISKTAEEQALSLTQLSQMNKSLKSERDDTARRLQDLTAELSTVHSSKEEIAIALKRSEDAMRRKEKECKLEREIGYVYIYIYSYTLTKQNKTNNQPTIPPHTHTHTGKDLKDALNELSRAATMEQEQLEDRMNHVILSSNDLRSNLRNTEQQLDETKERLRSLQVEYETARADAEGMLKVMNGMEKQLSEYAEREEQVVALSKESKERVEAALLERDQAVAREVQSRQEIARLLEKQKDLAVNRVEAEERAAENMRQKMLIKLKQRDVEVNDLSEKCVTLQTDLDRFRREKDAAVNERNQLLDEVNEERLRLTMKIEEFASKTTERVTRQNQAEEIASKCQQELMEKEQAMDLKLEELKDRLTSSNDRGEIITQKLTQRVGEIDRLNKTIEKRDHDLFKVREELDHFRTKDSEERNQLNQLHARQIADLQSQLESTTRTHKDAQEKTSALVIAQERMAERARRNLEDAVSHHQRMLRDKTDEAERAESRSRELEARLASMISEQQDMEDNYLKMASDLESALRIKQTAEEKARVTSKQLSQILEKEELKLKELTESKLENERLRRQVDRM